MTYHKSPDNPFGRSIPQDYLQYIVECRQHGNTPLSWGEHGTEYRRQDNERGNAMIALLTAARSMERR